MRPAYNTRRKPSCGGSAFLRVERSVGRAAQGTVGLQGKSGARKAAGKRAFGPLRRTIDHRSGWLTGSGWRNRVSRGTFGGAHACGSQVRSLVPIGGSPATEPGSGSIPVPRPCERPSGRHLVRCLRPPAPSQRTRGAGGAHHFPTLASLMTFGTHVVKATVWSRQRLGLGQGALASNFW